MAILNINSVIKLLKGYRQIDDTHVVQTVIRSILSGEICKQSYLNNNLEEINGFINGLDSVVDYIDGEIHDETEETRPFRRQWHLETTENYFEQQIPRLEIYEKLLSPIKDRSNEEYTNYFKDKFGCFGRIRHYISMLGELLYRYCKQNKSQKIIEKIECLQAAEIYDDEDDYI